MHLENKQLQWCGTTPSPDAIAKAALVQLILMDVDGVQTDGSVFYLPLGGSSDHLASGSPYFETKGFDSHDGLAFHMLKAAGIKYGAISGRKSGALEERASSMGFTYLYQGNLDKVPILAEIVNKSGLGEENIAYVGDDFTDIPIMRKIGLACAVANARPEVKSIAHFVTAAAGGKGGVREVAELVLKAQNKWADVVTRYLLDF